MTGVPSLMDETATISLWRRRDFVILAGGEALNQLGFGFSTVAMLLLTLQLTHSALWLGGVGIAYAAAALVSGLVAGALADSVDRRLLLVLADLAQLAVTAAIPLSLLLSAHVAVAAGYLVVCSVLLGAFGTLFESTFHTTLPRLVPRPDLPRANAALFAWQNLALLAGPALAGALIGVAGITWAFEIDALTFLASVLSVIALASPLSSPGPGSDRRLGRSVLEGARSLGREPMLRSVIGLGFLAYLGTASFFPLLVLRLDGELRQPPSVVGAVFAVTAAGGLIGSLAVSRLARRGRLGAGSRLTEGRTMLVAVVGGGGCYLAMVAATGPAAYAALGAGAEACAMVAAIAAVSLTQRITPDRLLGRVMGAGQVSAWCATLLGRALMGPLAAVGGAGLPLGVFGTELVMAACLAAFGPLSSQTSVRGPSAPMAPTGRVEQAR